MTSNRKFLNNSQTRIPLIIDQFNQFVNGCCSFPVRKIRFHLACRFKKLLLYIRLVKISIGNEMFNINRDCREMLIFS